MSNIVIQLHRALSVLTNIPLLQLSIISISVAVTSHVTFFCHSERDLLARPLFLISVLAPEILPSIFHFYVGLPFLRSLVLTTTILGSFWVGMLGSIVVYRIWFHPLRNFQGPFWAKVTKWWVPWTQWRSDWKLHLVTVELHKKYGDIVRVGPNDLAINHPDALQALAKGRKGAWYNIGYPEHSLHTTRSKKTHAIRKRVWDKAFTTKAIQGYAPKVMKYTDILISHISKTATTPIDITDWFNFYMLDVMGDLAFGKPFNYLKPEERIGAFDFRGILHRSGFVASSLGQVSYVLNILKLLGLAGDFQRFLDFCEALATARKEKTPENRDIFSYILDAEPQNKAPHYVTLVGEARLIVVAASDTTSTTLITIFTLLASDRTQLRKLQAEIDAIYDSYPDANDEVVPKEILNGGTIATQHLEGTISEALRYSPPVANGVQRLVPDEGMWVGGTWVPGGVHAMYSYRAAQMDDRWFPGAANFRPERWYESNKETMAKQRVAFAPFWLGAYECVGKPLANMQLRVVTARLLRKFDIELPEDIEAKKLLDNSWDTFTLLIGSVKVIFRPREI